MNRRAYLTLILAVIATMATSQVREKPAIEVIVFLGLDCPVSQKYMSRLNELNSSYEGKASFRGLVPEHVKDTDIKRFAEEYKARFTIVRDDNLEMVRKYKATITPEVLVIQDGTVKYQGAIDNWFYELGRYRKETTAYYLKDALTSLLKGETPVTTKTEAIGCFIQNTADNHHQHH